MLREGTEDEWVIIKGLVEGTIVCRKFPPFTAQLMRTEERLRFLGTIQAQVEGHLRFSLGNENPVPIVYQTTNGILDTIIAAAETRKIHSPHHSAMLQAVKTASYDSVTNSVHLFFFTRTAAKYARLSVPFRRYMHTLHNVHGDSNIRQNIWERQDTELTELMSAARKYTIRLVNVSRFMDISRLHAFLKSNLAVPFEMEELDECGPRSHTSNEWEVRFKLDGCPDKLKGIRRINWFGTWIIVRHPHIQARKQCMTCGEQGHYMKQCKLAPKELQGKGCITVREKDITQLAVEPPTFTSLQELKSVIAARLAELKPEDCRSRSNSHSTTTEQPWKTQVNKK
ncbi:unnamed protein product [Phytophthora fragariaefolia]|uniref:Unnamed protein product n=1 Tax=Phytophthora fragariaefolia TaxID=1490495 RepID=A0A9W7CYZ7_9STRA|nr:unnamed protein product [Phytophthora fragariaefolia]